MDIIKGKNSKFWQTAHGWPAFSSTKVLELANCNAKQKGIRSLNKEQEIGTATHTCPWY